MTNHPELIDSKNGVLLAVHLQPGAGTAAIMGRHGEALKVRVAAPPVGGQANKALVALIAKEFDLTPSAVEVVAGETSRSKRVRLGDLDRDAAAQHVERILRGPRHKR
ncbi:MAG: DUF167 domain-containing protein [Acidimicrobiales bacterium]